MILESENKKVLGSGVERHRFTIAATENIFQTLSTRLYTNPIRAIVRELLCNAIDATIEGKAEKKPVVHLPTALDPVFYVEDFGIGMTEDEIFNVYSQYGNSSKGDSNEVIGGLGLGSKSPFSRVQQFTVDSCKNGVKNMFMAFLNENGEPCISKVGSEPCEQSGTKVTLSVQNEDINSYARNLEHVLHYAIMLPEVRNLNGAFDWKDIEEERTKIQNTIVTFKNRGWRDSECHLIMGGVDYDLDLKQIFPENEKFLECFNRYFDINLPVEIGAVAIQASREALNYSKNTVEFLQNLIIVKTLEYLKEMAETTSSSVGEDFLTFYSKLEYIKDAFNTLDLSKDQEELLNGVYENVEKLFEAFVANVEVMVDTDGPSFFKLRTYSCYAKETAKVAIYKSKDVRNFNIGNLHSSDNINAYHSILQNFSNFEKLLALPEDVFSSIQLREDQRVRYSLAKICCYLGEKEDINFEKVLIVRDTEDTQSICKMFNLTEIDYYKAKEEVAKIKTIKNTSKGISPSQPAEEFEDVWCNKDSAGFKNLCDSNKDKEIIFTVLTAQNGGKACYVNDAAAFLVTKCPKFSVNDYFSSSDGVKDLYERLYILTNNKKFNTEKKLFVSILARDYKKHFAEIDKVATNGLKVVMDEYYTNDKLKNTLKTTKRPGNSYSFRIVDLYSRALELNLVTKEQAKKSEFFTSLEKSSKYVRDYDNVNTKDKILDILHQVDGKIPSWSERVDTPVVNMEKYAMLSLICYYGNDEDTEKKIVDYVRLIEKW